ncbi:Crp/Fnr family transcriptional regulator [Listeria booriae]|uniref:Crp/Fnr family transcriptional regulator n=1 Tax=Listeria booriae TaxID=1552123 RepID=UPI00162AAF32|nr:Crp/Fnr family transcriptional regulator [Listeria booriae]MBC1814140.1 Crp/Fnr family transcriptional regulator [Listeria booriae]
MKTIFNYQQFIQLSEKGNINFEKIIIPKRTQLIDNKELSANYVYLIIDGYVATSLGQETTSIYTILGKGSFINYSNLLELNIQKFTFKTLSECVIYKYAFSDLEYFLSMFPENFGFQFFIMKEINRHSFLKSLLSDCIPANKLELSFSNIGKFHGELLEPNSVMLPKAIRTKVIAAYSGRSKSSFYNQLALLTEQGKIAKPDNCWIVHDSKLYEYVKTHGEEN